MKNKYTYPTDETKCIDEGICPECGKRFDPERHKLSEWGHDYQVKCPNCGRLLHVFESVEYQIDLNVEDD